MTPHPFDVLVILTAALAALVVLVCSIFVPFNKRTLAGAVAVVLVGFTVIAWLVALGEQIH